MAVDTSNIRLSFNLCYSRSGGEQFELAIDTTIPGQGVTAIFGESGSGKTTLLRCIAGLLKAPTANLNVNGELWQDASVFVPTHKRGVGYVFQEASLFEHLSVADNLAYAIKRAPKPSNPTLLTQVVEVMGIEHLMQQKPEQLSGGERQRVAIARALLSQPKLLLMDEPLASLDSARKLEILPYLERLRRSYSIPILYVTHSVDEIVRLADHAVILKQGKAMAQGAVTELFSRADLQLGAGNHQGAILECKLLEKDSQWQLMKVAFAGGELCLPSNESTVTDKLRVRILASDISLTLTPHTDTSILNVLYGVVDEIIFEDASATCLVRLKVGDSYLLARLTKKSVASLNLKAGLGVWLQIKSAAIVR